MVTRRFLARKGSAGGGSKGNVTRLSFFKRVEESAISELQ
jgi:hypothetical protein